MRTPGANMRRGCIVAVVLARHLAVRPREMTSLTVYEVGNEKSQHADHISDCVR